MHNSACAYRPSFSPEGALYLDVRTVMSSSSSGPGSSVSWSYVAASVLAGVGAGYALGVASSRWLAAGESATRRGSSRPPAATQQALDGAASGSLVAAVVELTAEVCVYVNLYCQIEARKCVGIHYISILLAILHCFVSLGGAATPGHRSRGSLCPIPPILPLHAGREHGRLCVCTGGQCAK